MQERFNHGHFLFILSAFLHWVILPGLGCGLLASVFICSSLVPGLWAISIILYMFSFACAWAMGSDFLHVLACAWPELSFVCFLVLGIVSLLVFMGFLQLGSLPLHYCLVHFRMPYASYISFLVLMETL